MGFGVLHGLASPGPQHGVAGLVQWGAALQGPPESTEESCTAAQATSRHPFAQHQQQQSSGLASFWSCL